MTTVTQWIEQAPADVKARFEFFDGRWQEKPMAGLLHQDHVFLITAELKRRGLRAYFDVVTHLPEIDERTGKRVEVHADVLVIAAGNPDQGGDGDYGRPRPGGGGRLHAVRRALRREQAPRLRAQRRAPLLAGAPDGMTVEPFRLVEGRYRRAPGSTSSRSRRCPSPPTCSTPDARRREEQRDDGHRHPVDPAGPGGGARALRAASRGAGSSARWPAGTTRRTRASSAAS